MRKYKFNFKEPTSFGGKLDICKFLEMTPRSKCKNKDTLTFYIDIELVYYINSMSGE